MRNRFAGLTVAILTVAGVGVLVAPRALATDYFVKNLQSTTQGFSDGCDTPPTAGVNHGTVVFKRTTSAMTATVHLRGGPPNTPYRFRLMASTSKTESGTNDVCGSHDAFTSDTTKSTDGNGDADIVLGPAKFFGNPYHDFFPGHPVPLTYTCGTDTGQDPDCVHLKSFWVYTDASGPAFRTVRVPTNGF